MGLFSSKSKSKSWLEGWQPAMDQIENGLMPLLGRGMGSDWSAYGGDTVAGLNPYQLQAVGGMADFAGGTGQQMSDALAQAGFSQLGGLGQSQSFLNDMLGRGTPQNTGVDMGQVQNIVGGMDLGGARAAMLRDPYRGLTENALPGTENAMNRGGMLNSSANDTQSAILQRGFADRAADVDSSLYNNAYNTALGIESNRAAQNPALALQGQGQQIDAARSLGNIGNAGSNLLNQAFNLNAGNYQNLLGAGGLLQGQDQREMDAAQAQHYMNQQLPLQQAQGYGTMLSQLAQQFGTSKGKQTNSNSPLAVGTSLLGGALMGGMNPFSGLGSLFGGWNPLANLFGGTNTASGGYVPGGWGGI